MNSISRLAITVLFFLLLGSGMFLFSQGFLKASLTIISISIALLTIAIIKFDKSKQKIKTQLTDFARSNNINPEYIFIDVTLAKAIGIDKGNQKVVSFENNRFAIENLDAFSGAEIEKSNNSNVTFYRKSESNPVLKLKIRNGQFQDYSSYIQTVFE